MLFRKQRSVIRKTLPRLYSHPYLFYRYMPFKIYGVLVFADCGYIVIYTIIYIVIYLFIYFYVINRYEYPIKDYNYSYTNQ